MKASLPTREAADYLGVSIRYLEKRRREGGGPRFVRIAANRVSYRIQDLEQWQEARLCDNNIDLTVE